MSVAVIRKRARLLMWLVTIPFAALAVLTVLLLGNIVLQGGRYADAVAILYLPMVLYMWAIWLIRDTLKAISAGAIFDRILPKLIFRIGVALFGGALFTVFGIPLLTALVWDKPYISTFEPSPITLGIVGAALVLFAQLFERATEMQDEIESFF